MLDYCTKLPVVVLIALNTLHSGETEKEYMRELLDCLSPELKFKQIQGQWDGTCELSYVIALPENYNQELENGLLNIARLNDQECIMYLLAPDKGKRKAIMQDVSTKELTFPGYFVPCTQSQAYQEAGWTFDASTGQHYILEEASSCL